MNVYNNSILLFTIAIFVCGFTNGNFTVKTEFTVNRNYSHISNCLYEQIKPAIITSFKDKTVFIEKYVGDILYLNIVIQGNEKDNVSLFVIEAISDGVINDIEYSIKKCD